MENFSEERENLKEFLHEADLQQYYELFRDTLKVTKVSQLKFVVIDDLAQIGLSKPEQRRYKKTYSKYFPNPYISKIKKLLNTNRKNDQYLQAHSSMSLEFQAVPETNVKVPTKHIIPIEDITINKELGMGQFGVVQQGTWTTGNQRLQVAIKCLGNERMTSNSTEFLKEAAVMHSVSHPSIVRLFGVVLHLDSLMLVTELAPLRSLLECLRETSLRASFPVIALCRFAEQIADGMAYLENKRLIHRDLAARNILVFSKDRVKISDFGLSRALGVGKDYYQTNYNVNLKLPVAWCAPECILYLRFTSASDVWAWGVCLWEMFTYGFQPWAGFSGHQILEAIDAPNHQRLERPECCSEQYISMMQQCWAHEPRQRPTFRDLQRTLPTIRPEQVQAIVSFKVQEEGRRSNMLEYKAGQVITVLGKESMTKSSLWYGALDGGTCGVFEPSQTTPYLKSERVVGSPRRSLLRSDVKRHTFTGGGTGGKRSGVRRAMISAPQGDLKHTSHVGFDGAYFGDISFLDPAVCVPRGVVAPYDAARDVEQQPLLPPHSPTAPLLTPGAMRPQQLNLNNAAKTKSLKKSSHISILDQSTSKSILNKVRGADEPHEYHEISDTDTESTALEAIRAPATPATPCTPDSPAISKSMEFSQSLLDEMESLFRNIDRRDLADAGSVTKFDSDAPVRAHTMSKAERKKASATCSMGTMKMLSAYDERTLDNAVALANQITTRSMNEIASSGDSKPPQSPSEKSKFQLKFPLMHHNEADTHTHKNMERRNFSEEAKSVPDIQETLTEQSKLAYASLIEQSAPASLALAAFAGAATVPKPAPARSHRFHSLQKPTSNRPIPLGDSDAKTADFDQILNELPLPPRTSKPKLVDKPRHVRKYPLKLPGSESVSQKPAPMVQGQAIYQNAFVACASAVTCGGNSTGAGVDVFDGASTNPFSASSNPFTSFLPTEDHKKTEQYFEDGSLVKESAVSTEDLLQFAARAPCGRQRGAESDEVRVISKVLHHRASPEQCLEALELCDWEVHHAIKVLRVSLAVGEGSGGEAPPLSACREQLEKTAGDVLKASASLLLAARHQQ